MQTRRHSTTWRLSIGLAVLVAASFALPACQEKGSAPEPGQKTVEPTEPEQQVKEGAGEMAGKTEAQMEEEHREFIQSSKQRLDELERKVQDLENHLQQMGDKASQETRQALENLKEKRKQAQDELEKARQATKENWQQIKQGTQEALDELESRYNAALEQMKTKE